MQQFFTSTQLACMASMQNKLQHTALGDNWETLGHDYWLAASQELAECQDHLGWKWWAKQTANLKQAKMELVDTFHFMLCAELVTQANYPAIDRCNYLDQLVVMFEFEPTDCAHAPAVTEKLKLLQAVLLAPDYMLVSEVNPYALLAEISVSLGLSGDDFFKLYVGKNLLNGFRKRNGYKQGTYVKMWGDMEDNVVLAGILDKYSPDVEGFEELVLEDLQEIYDTQVNIAN